MASFPAPSSEVNGTHHRLLPSQGPPRRPLTPKQRNDSTREQGMSCEAAVANVTGFLGNGSPSLLSVRHIALSWSVTVSGGPPLIIISFDPSYGH